MRCERVIRNLDTYRTGEVAADVAAALERHLGRCSPCRRSLEDLERLAANSRSLVGRVPCSCLEAVKEAIGDRYDFVDTDLGRLFVAFSKRGVKELKLVTDASGASADELVQEYRLQWRRELEPATLSDELRDQVERAAAGHRDEDPRVDLSLLRPFQRRVLEVLASIPRGEVRTYAWVAREAGSPRAVRAVGSACAKNPVPLVMPCHRVVPAMGGTGDYAYGARLKREVLRSEGVSVERLDELERQGARYFGFPDSGVYCFPTCSGALDDPEDGRVLLHDAREAKRHGLEPCPRCRPLAA